MPENEPVITWYGVDVEKLSRDELLKAFRFLAAENRKQRNDLSRWIKSGSALNYLMTPETHA